MSKFKNIDIKHFMRVVPRWAIDPMQLARKLDELMGVVDFDVREMKFWIEVYCDRDPIYIRFAVPDGGPNDQSGNLIIENCNSDIGGSCQITIPLYAIIKHQKPLTESYVLYMHGIDADVPLYYIGISKNPWFDRLSQHRRSAQSGSRLMFHEAIRQHWDKKKIHRLILYSVNQDAALHFEEEWVQFASLYPLGLNMIPGGLAGFKYLSKIGVEAKNSEERDSFVESLANNESKSNPLCAARWASDQDYVNRVICGGSGRLSVDQVRSIRLWSSFGFDSEYLSEQFTVSPRRVRGVISGNTYSRVA